MSDGRTGETRSDCSCRRLEYGEIGFARCLDCGREWFRYRDSKGRRRNGVDPKRGEIKSSPIDYEPSLDEIINQENREANYDEEYF